MGCKDYGFDDIYSLMSKRDIKRRKIKENAGHQI